MTPYWIADLLVETEADLSVFYDMYKQSLTKYAKHLLGDKGDWATAEDIVQNAYLKTMTSGRRQLDSEGARQYLAKAVRSVAYSWIRQQSLQPYNKITYTEPPESTTTRWGDPSSGDPLDALHAAEVRLVVKRTIQPDSLEHKIFVLYSKGYTLTDIASTTGNSIGAVKGAFVKLKDKVKRAVVGKWGGHPDE